MSKTWYRAAPGVAWVNGAPVPEDRLVRLTAVEAAYDLSLGRIVIEAPENAKQVSPLPPPRRRRGRAQ